MIFVTDAAGQTIHTSAEWTALTGQSIADSLGHGWLACVHPDDREVVGHTVNEAIRTISEFSIRYRIVGPDGSPRWVSVGCIPSLGPPGNTFLGYLGSLTELTEGSADAAIAYGNVGRFVPPPTHRPGPVDDNLDQIADYLILANALVEADDVRAALPGLRHALIEVGRAIAARSGRRSRLN